MQIELVAPEAPAEHANAEARELASALGNARQGMGGARATNAALEAQLAPTKRAATKQMTMEDPPRRRKNAKARPAKVKCRGTPGSARHKKIAW